MPSAVRRLIVLALSLGTAVLNGQQVQPLAQSAVASFELTSVKRNISGDGRTSTRAQPNGGWSATNVRLRAVIARAYEVREFQIESAPDWVNFDRFDIVARGSDGTPASERFAMLRAMLADDLWFVPLLSRDQTWRIRLSSSSRYGCGGQDYRRRADGKRYSPVGPAA